ncbi:MAG: hypothetical protein OES47_11460 [Acidobacteriota bacterium]|nr:hypothetical protein [Acidobacteriota bacterium]
MSATIRRVEYFYATVKDQPGAAYSLLSALAETGVNLLAFSAVPSGPAGTQLVLFPESSGQLTRAAGKAGLALEGPEHAILVQGDDRLGVLVDIHRKLFEAKISVYASHGVTDGKGHFGYVVYVRSARIEEVARALGI